MATTAWSWTRAWSRYKCTSRREREQMFRTLRTGRPSERFALMLMVLYWFVCGVFLSLFLWWHQWNQNDPKQTRSTRAYRKEPVLLKSVSHRVYDDGLFCVCSSVRAASMTAALASINDRTRCLYRVRSSFDWTGRMLHRDHSSLPLAACVDVSYLWRRHRNTHIFFRDFQIIWHLAHMHQLALCMRGLRLSFTKVCEERHFWYQIKSVRMTQLLFSQTSIVGWSDCLFRDATVLM